MRYKGYTAKTGYSTEHQGLMGHIANIGDDVVGFHADNIADLRIAFEQAVDDYLVYCTDLFGVLQSCIDYNSN